MFNPCVDHCYLKYGKQYNSECDEKCEYAKALKALEKTKAERDAAFEALEELYMLNSCNTCEQKEVREYVPPGQDGCSHYICKYTYAPQWRKEMQADVLLSSVQPNPAPQTE